MVSTGSTLHGGPDALGTPAHDFSTNVNAVGPCPAVLAVLQQLVPDTYPDPAYTDLRARLGDWHGVSADRILIGASGSELISRLTAAFHRIHHLPPTPETRPETTPEPDWPVNLPVSGSPAAASLPSPLASPPSPSGGPAVGVWLPAQAYGDYRRAAEAWGLPVQVYPGGRPEAMAARLIWACEPSSPMGQALTADVTGMIRGRGKDDIIVLDRAYEPLRLSGTSALSSDELRHLWQLITPNKALGLTGIRAAYLIAPDSSFTNRRARSLMQALHALAPSWPIGAHGVALLAAWADEQVQQWLQDAKQQLREWKTRQVEGLHQRGWTVLPGEANYVCARPPSDSSNSVGLLQRLRRAGIKLRDAQSFGLDGWVRLGVRPPADQQALWQALDLQDW